MNLLGAGKSPFVKQYALTDKKKKMSFSQQGPYRAVGYVQQPTTNVSLGSQAQSLLQNSIFNSKKNVVSITGEQFVLQSSEYQQKQARQEASLQSRGQNQLGQSVMHNAVIRIDNNGSRVNLQQINVKADKEQRDNHM